MFNNDDLTRLLEAVSEPMRMQMVFLLTEHDRLNVGEIARQFRISRPVRSEKSGQEVYYWIDSQRIVAALRALADKIERSTSSETSST